MSGPGATPAAVPLEPSALSCFEQWGWPKSATRLLSVLPLACIIAACAPLEVQRPPAEPRIEYRSYPVDRHVPCFTEAERPRLEPPTPIDLETATVDQKAAALAADMENERLFTAAVDRIFEKCQAKGTP